MPAPVKGRLSPMVKSSKGRSGAVGTTSLCNNSDTALTLKGENIQVYVLNHKGKPLMPCSPRKARLRENYGGVLTVSDSLKSLIGELGPGGTARLSVGIPRL